MAYFGKMQEKSVGKDTMTGHWEIMGLNIDTPFNVYPDGFPQELIMPRLKHFLVVKLLGINQRVVQKFLMNLVKNI